MTEFERILTSADPNKQPFVQEPELMLGNVPVIYMSWCLD